MNQLDPHAETHRTHRVGWLRAAVLGANDGIVSTASLIIGVAATDSSQSAILTAGTAGLVAGAMSMAAGEYVSVASQADTERADAERESQELRTDPDGELEELVSIYRDRGLNDALAAEVATELTAHDALGAHLRDEIGLSEWATAKPVQAAVTSAATFGVGAVLPLLAAAVTTGTTQIAVVAAAALFFLGLLGALGAMAGGATPTTAAVRVTFWGALAMTITAAIGSIVGATI